MSAFDLKLPPPVLALFLALLMWLSSSFVTPFNIPFAYRLSIALAIAAVGTSIGVAAKLAFRRSKTTVNPLKPEAAPTLVTGGLYRFTRNPMYLGRSLQLLAWAVYLGNGFAFLLASLFVLYITRFQILPEERALSERFGSQYAEYVQAVRRWV